MYKVNFLVDIYVCSYKRFNTFLTIYVFEISLKLQKTNYLYRQYSLIEFLMIKKIIAFLICFLWINACVVPFETITSSQLKVLVVDAILTNEDRPQTVKIQTSIHQNETIYNSEIHDLKVELLVNNKESFTLSNQGAGVYVLLPSFRAKVGNSYKLKFQKPDGTIYESDEQIMPSSPIIDKIYDIFEVDGIEKGITKIPDNAVYIDFKDPADEKNYYLWTWNLWERQYVCLTQYNYDYYCNQNCWEIFHNDDWNIFSDIYSNGKPIFGKLIVQVPYYQTHGSLLEIKQLGINEATYRFLKLINDQTKRTGTLVDTPPAAIVGNIKNLTNPSEAITGFFIVASVNTVEYWLDRENAAGKARPIGILGRTPNPTTNNATYICIEGPNRTPTKPRNWID